MKEVNKMSKKVKPVRGKVIDFSARGKTDKNRVKKVIDFSAKVEVLAASHAMEIINECECDMHFAEAVADRISGMLREARWGEYY